MIEVLQKLWTGRVVEHHGEHFDFPRVQLSPAPGEPPPIYIGGASEIALRRAARVGDGYIGAGTDPDDVPGLLQRLHELREEYDRADRPFEAMLGLTAEPSLTLFERMLRVGLESTVVAPFAYTLGKRSSLDDKKRQMEHFAESVIRRF
jgi:alkanesulfonate monooxygenase SsuD/methylene tetrahydromethanopterin reductase-like flavin-dependent oxidoreductase (luciferase family)